MKRLSLFLLAFYVSVTASAQTTSQAYRDYIEKYKATAVRQMRENRIPASIIMAQALLESSAGRSELSVKANNHFGIKCTSEWTGKTMLKDDDRKNECFRKYDHPEESYRDHSLFLKHDRYSSLYVLEPTDYVAWAKGLKAAGYATDPLYAEKLIRLIENYSLHTLDIEGAASMPDDTGVQTPGSQTDTGIAAADRNAMYRHANKGIMYVVAFEGDTAEDIAKRFKVSVDKLLLYNELRYDSQLVPGQYVFLAPKKTKGVEDFYTVREGDTMYLIAQKTGVTIKTLYDKNRIKQGVEPLVGTKLYLKRTLPRKQAVNWYNR